jgi:hypothetical protein
LSHSQWYHITVEHCLRRFRFNTVGSGDRGCLADRDIISNAVIISNGGLDGIHRAVADIIIMAAGIQIRLSAQDKQLRIEDRKLIF